MVQLKIVSGQTAGTHWVARHFPVRIGRASTCDLRLEEAGVWDEHVKLNFTQGEGFLLNAHTDALVAVNGQTVRTARLRNGDMISLGSVQLQFWLGDAPLRGYRLREWFVWSLVAAVVAAQVFLVYRLGG
jgi:predicted component of type VI protein secretion system